MSKPHNPNAKNSNINVRPILVIGRPWSGKGTLCKRLIRDHPCRFGHFDMGAALRQRAEDDESFAQIYARYETTLVPDEIIFETLEMSMRDCRVSSLLIDGVPRNVLQGQAILSYFRDRQMKTPIGLHVNATKEISFERLKKFPREDRKEHLLKGDGLLKYFEERMDTFEQHTWPLVCRLKDRFLINRVRTLQVRFVDAIDGLVPQALAAIDAFH